MLVLAGYSFIIVVIAIYLIFSNIKSKRNKKNDVFYLVDSEIYVNKWKETVKYIAKVKLLNQYGEKCEVEYVDFNNVPEWRHKELHYVLKENKRVIDIKDLIK